VPPKTTELLNDPAYSAELVKSPARLDSMLTRMRHKGSGLRAD